MATILFVSSAKDLLTDLKTLLMEECSGSGLDGRWSALLGFLPEVASDVVPGGGAGERRYL